MTTTESNSLYSDLEKMSIKELLFNINQEDQKVAIAINEVLESIGQLVAQIVSRMKKGGRLFYIGAGTSGRLGIVDASECPPTFGVSHDLVVGLIAGGDSAIRKAVEFAEDDEKQAWKDLSKFNLSEKDTLIGIAASGRTPYVIGGLKKANENGLLTGCIVCNQNSKVAAVSQFPIEVIVGAEFVTGSTRMKAGTAQKLVLNMISTAVMIQLGKIKGNKMVDMQLSNLKLIERGTRFLIEELEISEEKAKELLLKHGSVREVLNQF
ncbi:N-acetylmuramic acid 6-phosphate etherase [Bernardetia litoralis DSM 6794]|uniref:N-acetylmuramic acid 6-phosphate etherase n=1 Tax=Bernardetia litoralis (strain ATCC 23117 / DSM 6794 / NBRC 15988 / NCIMB 1366 / Fx l1 / Sio-4) TaxID=880071 RepID=I4AHW5_BERLS|nr:N-acetylmuramic acid 6-phosphate etherase [Bernardetia litoralis]AFM03550.1 N-acetylmuramic acid 6-phosphate etherase [Bernardetia litoralis DSM 6794]